MNGGGSNGSSSNWEAFLFRALQARWLGVDAGIPRPDAAHDVGHVRRVLRLAREIAAAEGPHDGLALTAAAILHDLVALPKNSPDRHLAAPHVGFGSLLPNAGIR